MGDRTTNKIYSTSGADRFPVPIANGESLGIGALVQVESGFANHYDGTSDLLGIVVGGENTNSSGVPVGDTSLSPDPTVYVDMSGALLMGVPVASAAAVGEYVYCNDSDFDNATVTQPTTDKPIGVIVGWRSASDCDVKLFTLPEHMLGTDATGAAWV
jgi:hypothetical protein